MPAENDPRILLDLYKTKDLQTGLGRFSLQFAQHAAGEMPGNWRIEGLLPAEAFPLEAGRWPARLKLRPARFWQRWWPESQPRYQLWHSLHQFPSFWPPSGTPLLLTLHDLNFLVEKKGWKIQKYLRRLQRNVDRADALVCISKHTERQARQHLDLGNTPLRLIPSGVEFPQTARPDLGDIPLKGPFLFSLGVFKEKKNFGALLPLMEHCADYQLVMAGNSDTAYGRRLREEIRRRGLEGRVLVPGKISDAQRDYLYQNCRAFLFPSLAEGFGMPVVEAMRYGKAVFLSRHSSLPEVGGPHACYFDDFDGGAMHARLRKGLAAFDRDPEMAQALKRQAARFSWRRCMADYVEVYRSLL